MRTMKVVYESRRCAREWEPMASTLQSRLRILRKAHDYVDFWKVGKLNHNKAVEQSALGPKFRDDTTALLEHYGCSITSRKTCARQADEDLHFQRSEGIRR